MVYRRILEGVHSLSLIGLRVVYIVSSCKVIKSKYVVDKSKFLYNLNHTVRCRQNLYYGLYFISVVETNKAK